jgi:chromosome segregation ATPase
MKLRRIAPVIILILSFTALAVAQDSSIESLRSQLSDAQKREGEIQARVKQLEEDMKPENLEKFFALNGSTRPEALREERRRQLESQRTTLRTQLDQLAQSRVRLEAAIATAEAAAYRRSALQDSYKPATTEAAPGNSSTVKPKQTPRRVRQRRARRNTRRGQ